jgi:hypothetical protein
MNWKSVWRRLGGELFGPVAATRQGACGFGVKARAVAARRISQFCWKAIVISMNGAPTHLSHQSPFALPYHHALQRDKSNFCKHPVCRYF